MAELPKERLDEREFERQLESLWSRVKKGEFTDKESLQAEFHLLMQQAGLSPDVGWGYGETNIDFLIKDIIGILPYVHLGVPIVETRRKIIELKDRLHWGPKKVKGMVREIGNDIRMKRWSATDLGLPENWDEAAIRTSVVETGKRQLAGLNASTHEKPKATGMRDLENYLRKHGLTMQDLEEQQPANS